MPIPPPQAATVARALWVPAVLLIFALVLYLDPLPFISPVPEELPVAKWVTSTTPVRQPKPGPEYEVAVFRYECSDCHRILPPSLQADHTLIQHTEIHLEHGINSRCLNCHHPTNRDVFVDDSGGEIPWNQPQLLCAKCHGPVYRDWQHGSHGRTNGYWLETAGPQTRRKCIECHDPHRPPFPPMHPAPGPHTLRMSPRHDSDRAETYNPLRLDIGSSLPAASDQEH
ncbi:MAG: hypothetical protein JJ992_16605 [Planctomycetes bacterium]|nr:hypothetical protein [Planctomycetota bacterium]